MRSMIRGPFLKWPHKIDPEKSISLFKNLPMLLNSFLQLAIRAHNGTSFTPEKRGKDYIESYSAELVEDLAKLPEDARADYEERYKRFFSAWLNAKCNCLSTMITGGSNFPVRRAEKANNTERRRSDEFRQFREKYFARIARNERREARENSDPLAEMRDKLENAEKLQKWMVAANKVVNNKKLDEAGKIAGLVALGFTEGRARQILTPDSCNRIGFAAYQLQNNNANIKRMRERVAELEAKAAATTTETEREDGIKIVENAEADRLQIFFPGKPDAETIGKLKRNAFKWSPSQGCWQRQLTGNAIHAMRQIIQ